MSRHFGGGSRNSNSGGKKALLIGLSAFFLMVFIVLAAVLVKQSSGSSGPVVQENDNNNVNLTEILVPVRKIELSERLSANMFSKELRSRFSVPETSLKDFYEIDGFYSGKLLVPGQPITREDITRNPPSSVLTTMIPAGYRAIAINVNSTTSVEGWARPGSVVDVLWITRVGGKDTLSVIVQNAKVLSAERNANNNVQDPNIPVPSTVTLLVSANDAQKISLAASQGQLNLTLKSGDDTGFSPTSPITSEDIIKTPQVAKPIEQNLGTVIFDDKKYLVLPGGALKLVEE